MPSVSLRHISKVYPGGVTAVRDLNLEIQDREFIVLTGPSGSGKSTVLRLVAGLEKITEGALYIDGQLMNGRMPKDRDVAMVFQDYPLYPHMTVFENMAFSLKLRHVPRHQIRERVEEAARILDLTPLLGRRPRALSGGQRQRAALGCAIVREPKVLLLDEPLSNLDARQRGQMRAEITRLHQRLEATVLYVTHDQAEAMAMGSRVVILKDGVLQQADTPQQINDDPANRFVAGFIGALPMNFLNARLQQEGSQVLALFGDSKIVLPPDTVGRLKDPSAVGREVILGVRPEHIETDPAFLAAHPDAVLDARVEAAEQAGDQTELSLALPGAQVTIVARTAPSTPIRAGECIRAALDPACLHLFDPETGETLLTHS